MADFQLEWDKDTERLYETGDRNVVLYPYGTPATTGGTPYVEGFAWNGVTAITETPSGAEATDLWADDIKYATMRSAEQFGGTIEAYTYPDEFAQCDGSIDTSGVKIGQQARKAFGLAYITTLGNDAQLNDYGEKLHLVYGATCNPSDRSYSTINDSPEAITFSWEFTTTPTAVGTVDGVTYKPTSLITIDSTKVNASLYASFKKILFGDPSTPAVKPQLPLPAAVLAHFNP